MNKLLTKGVLSEQVEGALTSKGNCSIRKVKRANVLLLLARGQKAGQISQVE